MIDDLQNIEMSNPDIDRPSYANALELRRAKQLDFLLTVLQSINDNKGNPAIVHTLLQQHLDLIDAEIVDVLKNWANSKFAEVDEVISKESSPCNWAMIQHNLANAYQSRIGGERAENLEKSIDCYQAALTVRNKNNLPVDWAMTQGSLAITYWYRIKGDRSENLELSIECYRAALEVYTAELFPREWAKIQLSLARFSIEQLQNYQVATEYLQSAYEHLLANNNDTGLLAQTMFELARCFHQTGCLGQAKIYFKDSIRLYQRLEQPTQVAAVTSALGNLELQMGAIDDARIHLQTALEFYQAAGNLDRVASIQDLQKCLPEHSAEPAI